ncbi:MAG TPA: hypothetical protein VFP65_23845 [Anaeromyxobacteraceae bacterium]|nr:hypothetical protein [Anaeromyxobacteraceae bacterium]
MPDVELSRAAARRRTPSFQGPAGALAVPPHDVAGREVAMLVEGETSGRPLDEVLREYGCSRDVYESRLRTFRDGGLAGLIAAAPRAADPSRPGEIVRFIVTARLRDRERQPATIAADLSRLGYRVTLRSVERTLAGFGLLRRRAL